LILTKDLGKIFGISGQLVYGGFHCTSADRTGFETEILEYNIQGRMDILKFFYRKHNPRFGIHTFAGAGQFLFKSKSYIYKEGNITTDFHNTGTPEFVYFAGGGLNYRVNHSLRLAVEVSVRQAQNDKLDNLVKNNDPDYYGFINIGVSWLISDIRNPFNKQHDKAYKDLGLTRRR
jgi:hypothetical protein